MPRSPLPPFIVAGYYFRFVIEFMPPPPPPPAPLSLAVSLATTTPPPRDATQRHAPSPRRATQSHAAPRRLPLQGALAPLLGGRRQAAQAAQAPVSQRCREGPPRPCAAVSTRPPPRATADLGALWRCGGWVRGGRGGRGGLAWRARTTCTGCSGIPRRRKSVSGADGSPPPLPTWSKKAFAFSSVVRESLGVGRARPRGAD